MIAIWREIGTSEITEQRLVDQARVVGTNERLTKIELEKIRRKILTPRDGEENDIPVIEERIENESGQIEPLVKIIGEEHLILDELKALMIRNETEECLPFKKVDQRKLRKCMQ